MKTNTLDRVGAFLIAAGALVMPTARGSGGAAEGQPAAPPALDAVMAYLRFDAAAQKKLLAGEIITGQIDEATDQELAVSVAMLETRPLADVVKTIHELRDLEPTTVFHLLGDPPDESGLAEAGFTAGEAGEAGEFLKARPGSKFNLSSAEYQALAAFARTQGKGAEKTPEGLEAISDQYRRILRDRYAGYRAQGLSGIPGYDRGGGHGPAPQDDLFSANSSSGRFLGRYFPRFQQSLTEYPDHQAPGLEHQFFWSKPDVEDRPAFILSHRAYLHEAGFALIVERQYYVGHSYDAMQIVVGCLPHGDGTLVFYTNRTATERVAGFASGLAHNLGRGKMRDSVVELFKRLRDGGTKP